jgi:hypothetical protein
MEKLTGHPEYSIFVARAGVDDSEELRNAIDSWVWIIRPIREPGTHWSKEIPAHSQQTTEKTEQSNADNPHSVRHFGCSRMRHARLRGYLTVDVRLRTYDRS